MTDMWAFGVLGYVVCLGEAPFWNAQEALRGVGPGTRAAAALEASIRASWSPAQVLSGSAAETRASSSSRTRRATPKASTRSGRSEQVAL